MELSNNIKIKYEKPLEEINKKLKFYFHWKKIKKQCKNIAFFLNFNKLITF